MLSTFSWKGVNGLRLYVWSFVVCGFFFFQAEDGIRDDLVTGVQTCALPILAMSNSSIQALALEERGVDFYILETFSYIEELLIAIEAIRSFSGLPIVAQLTYADRKSVV